MKEGRVRNREEEKGDSILINTALNKYCDNFPPPPLYVSIITVALFLFFLAFYYCLMSLHIFYYDLL